MLATYYKRIEKIILTLIFIGIVAMFQPWFTSIVELFEPLAPDARLGRTFTREVAPVIFRYGFYATFLGTVAFIVISHYSIEDLQRAFQEKGVALTWLLILMPVVYGFALLGELSRGHNYATLLDVVNVICAIAVWNWKRWGLVGLGVVAALDLWLASSGDAIMELAILRMVLAIAVIALFWPRRRQVTQKQ